MKKALRYTLSLFCCVMCVPAAAEESERYPCGDYEYVLLENGSAEIAGYTGEDTEITIPGILDGYSVASIGDKAFYYCDSLTSISLPDSVESIGEKVFQGCNDITITVGKDSFARQYCIDNNISYTYTDANN